MTGGIILAAGLSSRMRGYKAMLPIGNTTFIKKVIGHMREAGVQTIVVVTGYRRAELEKHLSDAGVICVFNERFYETQMLDSVKLGIAALPEDCTQTFIIPVDVVLVPAAVYGKLAEAEGDFVRPVYDGRCGHPVLVRRSLFGSIRQYDGEGGLKGALAASGGSVTDVPLEDDTVLMDADTPEDYMKTLHRYDVGLGDQGRLHPALSIRLYEQELFCGDDFILLLELIDQSGSLTRAAAGMHISYTKAWQMLKSVEKQVSYPLMKRQAGGEDGGFSYLTAMGKELIARYRAMKWEIDRAAAVIFEKHFGDFRI